MNSPVREGGVDAAVSYLSAEGATGFVPAPLASGCLWAIERRGFPALTDGAIHCRSFGPNAC